MSSKRLDNALRLEGSPETFFHGIVIAVTSGAHAGGDAPVLKQRTLSQAAELAAAIRMMDAIGDSGAVGECHLQGILNQVGLHMVIHGPTDNLA